jgi:uncharacterized protein (TIGR02145 family)
MFRKIELATIALAIVFASHAQQYGSLRDSRDGKVYKTVKIGTQVWMAENLDVSTFRNGDTIPHAKTDGEWVNAAENKQPAWCYYNNNPTNGSKYGKLYNWWAVSDSRSLAPSEWHIPTDEEWTILVDLLGGESEAGKQLKNSEGWGDLLRATNKSGFSGLPGGYRGYSGQFQDLNRFGNWWTSSEGSLSPTRAIYRYLYSGNWDVRKYITEKRFGYSIRCVMN